MFSERIGFRALYDKKYVPVNSYHMRKLGSKQV